MKTRISFEHQKHCLLGIGSAVLFASLLLSTPAAAAADNTILKEVDRRLQHPSYEAYRKLVNIEPSGARKEFVLYTVKQGRDKVLALFLSPASEKGRSTLRLGENMWLYIPNVGKPLRITSLQSVTGGVFNNSDILRVDYTSEYDTKAIKTSTDTHLLTLKAKNSSVAYDKLEMTVDRKTLAPRVIKCFAASGMLIKTLKFKQIKDFGSGLKRPAVIETTSPLQKGYRSVMIFAKIKPKKLRKEYFSLSYMPRAGELR
ncbi:MAG: outer membrane lipoprotein-sorting protein [Deltaproteobacteria bacterium]|nr:outer membrane lipoprotein-sorting protein [Deltaproteobacteria bacterium]